MPLVTVHKKKKFSYEIFENRQKQCYIITFTTATDTIRHPFFGDFEWFFHVICIGPAASGHGFVTSLQLIDCAESSDHDTGVVYYYYCTHTV